LSAGEHRTDGGQPRVAGRDTVATHLLEVVKEASDAFGAEGIEVDLVGSDTEDVGEVLDEQAPSVAVARDGIRGKAALRVGVTGEVLLQRNG